MALHEVVQIKKVEIAGMEMRVKRQYIKYTESTVHSYVPEPGVVSQSGRVFKYEYTHPYLAPTLFNVNGKKFIIPTWQEVHPKTTLKDIEWIKPEKVELKEKGSWKFKSSSSDATYIVRRSGVKLTCNCPGFYRAKDRKCKHVKEVMNATVVE